MNEEALRDILSEIGQVGEGEIGEIAQAVIRRYGQLFPDWEFVYLALEKENGETRRRQLEAAFEFMLNHGQ